MGNWIAKIAFAKVAKRLATLAVAAVVSGVTKSGLESHGVNIDIDPNVATASVYGALELARNFVKTKLNLKWL